MTIRESYDVAARFVAEGYWRVDAQEGLVFGSSGRAISARNNAGYVYAQFTMPDGIKRATVRIHRVIWESVHGPIGTDLQINHMNAIKHDNRIANLEVVTGMENTQHSIRMGLKPEQPKGASAYCARLTEEQAREIKRRTQHGHTNKAVAQAFGISPSQVSKIRNGRQWAELGA